MYGYIWKSKKAQIPYWAWVYANLLKEDKTYLQRLLY